MKLHDVPTRKFLPTFERHEPRVQDHSAIKLYKECPRKYFYRMVLGYTAKKDGLATVFSWGTAYHKYREVMEETYMRLHADFIEKKKITPNLVFDIEKACNEANQAGVLAAITIFKPWPAGVTGKWSHYTQINFLKLLGAGFNWWKKEKENKQIKVLGVEQAFNMEMPAGYLIGGRYDQIIEWNGHLWIRDFKTTSKKLMYFTKGLDPNDQVTRYLYALSQLHNKRIQGVYFEIAWTSSEGKKDQKVVKSAISTHFVSRTPSQLETWVLDQDFYNVELTRSREEDRWPMNEQACNFCDYHIVCTKSNEPAMGNILKTQFIKKPWDHETVDQVTAEPED